MKHIALIKWAESINVDELRKVRNKLEVMSGDFFDPYNRADKRYITNNQKISEMLEALEKILEN